MNIGIYGMGRFGRYWAEMLVNRSGGKYTISVASRSHFQPPDGCVLASLEEVAQCDILFLTVAISAMEETLAHIAPIISSPCILCDTCSVKQYPCALMRRYIAPPVALIGTHPLFGPDSAGAHSELLVALTPVRATDSATKTCVDIFSALQLNTITLTPEEHDRQVATTQGITHLLGRALSALNFSQQSLSTLGYRKLLDVMTQTCNDSWQLFVDLQRYNPYSAQTVSHFVEALQKIVSEISSQSANTDFGALHESPQRPHDG